MSAMLAFIYSQLCWVRHFRPRRSDWTSGRRPRVTVRCVSARFCGAPAERVRDSKEKKKEGKATKKRKPEEEEEEPPAKKKKKKEDGQRMRTEIDWR